MFQEAENTEARIAALESSLKNMVYEYVCRSLFKVIHMLKFHPSIIVIVMHPIKM